ncbi:hypothetical protein LTR17_020410 [Elasticomyces elasticus]|nr:hypothetical protein LTR17_020410 [Elasticomyces elasticus]
MRVSDLLMLLLPVGIVHAQFEWGAPQYGPQPEWSIFPPHVAISAQEETRTGRRTDGCPYAKPTLALMNDYHTIVGNQTITMAAYETAHTINGKTYTIPPSLTLYPAGQASEVDLDADKLVSFFKNKNLQRDASTTTSTSVFTPPGSTSTTNVDLDVTTIIRTSTATPTVVVKTFFYTSTLPASVAPSSHSQPPQSPNVTAPTGSDWYPWAAMHSATPAACGKPGDNFEFDCHYSTCLLANFIPLHMTTAFRVAMPTVYHAGMPVSSDDNDWVFKVYTHPGPHFGQTVENGLYYPAIPSPTTHGKETSVVMTTLVPAPDAGRPKPTNAVKPPTCWDFDSCCYECRRSITHHVDRSNLRNILKWVGIAFAALVTLLLLACCIPSCIRRYRNRQIAKKVVDEKLASQPQQVVVTTAPGQAAPTTVVTTTPDDGRGTLGRRAEEGRGQVNFAPGTGPQATSTPEVITTTTPAAENITAVDPLADNADKVTKTATPADMEKSEEEKAANAAQQKAQVIEQTPVPVHDGAYDYPTGSQMADMGSMRGRKRKPDGRGNLLNLGF